MRSGRQPQSGGDCFDCASRGPPHAEQRGRCWAGPVAIADEEEAGLPQRLGGGRSAGGYPSAARAVYTENAALLRDARHLDDVEYLTEAEGRAAAETNAGQVRRAWDYWSS